MRRLAIALGLMGLVNALAYAEGTKQLSPAPTDTVALAINNATYGSFGAIGAPATNRLNFRIGDPAAESVYLGFSQAIAGGANYDAFHTGTYVDFYYRVVDPSGTPATGWTLVSAATANATSHQLAAEGPADLAASGGYAGTALTFAAGAPAGDYYVEFSLNGDGTNGGAFFIPFFDVTVARAGAAVEGRVFSRNWAMVVPPTLRSTAAGYDAYDRSFEGRFYVYSQRGFVSGVEFAGAGFRPLVFNIAFNESGTASTDDVTENLKSVDGVKRTNPQHEVFVNDPDPVYYPDGVYGTVLNNTDYPKLVGCASTGEYAVRVATTQPGVMEVLFDENQPGGVVGTYEPGTADRILMVRIDPKPGEEPPYIREVAWDGRDGNGVDIASNANLSIETTYSQVSYNLPIYDAEYLTNGFGVSLHRPAPPAAYAVVMQYDDTNIPEAPAGGESELNGCAPPCHNWTDFNFGNENTINTLWYARRQADQQTLSLAAPECGCAVPTDLTIAGKAFVDSDGDFAQGATEADQAGLTVRLYKDANGNDLPEAGEYVTATTTDASGAYSFTETVPTVTNSTTTSTQLDFNDGMQFGANYYAQYCAVGGYNGTNDAFSAGLRFESIGLPPGATVTDAQLVVTSAGRLFNATVADVAMTIQGVAADDAAAFSSGNLPNAQTYVANTATYTAASGAWVSGTEYTINGLTALVNDIVTRPGFASGNALALRLSSAGAAANVAFVQADADPAAAPRLVLTVNGPDLPVDYIVTLDAASAPATVPVVSDTVEFVHFDKTDARACSGLFRLAPDRDGDGVVDANDLDNDNDGTPDAYETGSLAYSPTGDEDGDGIPNYLDLDDAVAGFTAADDANGDGIVDGYDTDGDGVPDVFDLDSDNDGIPDLIEAGGTDVNGDGVADDITDTDGDGLVDLYDNNDTDGPIGNGIDTTTPGTSSLVDANADGVDDYPAGGVDTDGDGIPNAIDRDSDNDGLADVTEAGGTDADGDGVIDATADADGDGLADAVDPAHDGPDATPGNDPGAGTPVIVTGPDSGDGTPTTPCAGCDADGDGRAPMYDLDSDGDGLPDLVEAGGTDTNGDGVVDAPADADGDGIADAYDTAHDGPAATAGNDPGAGATLTDPDTDGDGIADRNDLDADNDGIADVVEAGGTDADGDGIADATADANGDGLADVYAGANALVPTGTDADGDGAPDTYPTGDSDGDGVLDQLDLDADNDGIADVTEAGGTDANGDGRADGFLDADGDGLSDVVDGDVGNDGTAESTANALIVTGPDADGDGAPDSYPAGDTDGDGLLDLVDLDADNDGIADAVEAGRTDVNGDGRADGFVDADGDGLSDVVDGDPGNALVVGDDSAGANPASPVADTDGDGVPDHLDLDADNDGIADAVEAGGIDADGDGRLDATADADGDGLDDSVDADPANALPVGSDAPGTNAAGVLVATGADTNGDGRPDSVPAAHDLDGDGVADHLDLDTDNDGIADLVEAYGIDADGDGRVDDATDLDGDGLADVVDGDDDTTATANDGNGALVVTDAAGNVTDAKAGQGADFDGDGFANWRDRDSDNDGIADLVEAGVDPALDADQDGRLDQGAGFDLDGDGLADAFDADANDGPADGGGANPDGTPAVMTAADADGDGSAIGEGFAATYTGTDGDGLPDYRDLDSDDDGIADVVEQAGGATTQDAASGPLDGQMELPAGVDFVANTTYAPLDTDGDGVPDYRDVDADNDGIVDNLEATCTGCPTAGAYSGVDANANGVDDAFEGLTAANATGGANVGVTPVNVDGLGDGADYLDLDTDGDGASDFAEGWDVNGDGKAADDLILIAASYETANGNPGAYTTVDTDGDGFPDWLDNQPTVAGYDETARPPFLDPASAFWLDANGNGLADLTDETAGGTATNLPDRDGINDADWRDLATAAPLPVTFVALDADVRDCRAEAHWTVASERDVDYYAVYYSADGSGDYRELARRSAAGLAAYAADLPAGTRSGYLRLVAVDFDGQRSESPVVRLDLGGCDGGDRLVAKVYPVPALRGQTVTVVAPTAGELNLVDGFGRVVRRANVRAGERHEIATEQLAAGVYQLRGAGLAGQRVVVQ